MGFVLTFCWHIAGYFCVFLSMCKKTVLLAIFSLLLLAAGAQVSSKNPKIPKWKMSDVVHSFSAKNDTTYIVNFWATFCKPCIAEIPDFLRLAEKYKSKKVKLLLVSLDLPSYYPEKIKAFAKKNNYNTNIAWLNETNADIFCPMIDPKWSGAIPATIIVNNKTGYRKFVEDQVKPEDFENWLKEATGETVINKYKAPMNDAVVTDNESTKHIADATPMEYVLFKSKDSAVFSVADGKVTTIVKIENMKVVIISNDNGFYTYANLGSTVLKTGDIVKPDQFIGFATKNLDGEVALELYLNNHKGETVPLSKENFISRKVKSR